MNFPAPDSPMRAAVALGAAVLLALTLVGGLFAWLRDDIHRAREAHFRNILGEALSAIPHDNDPVAEQISFSPPTPPAPDDPDAPDAPGLAGVVVGALFPVRNNGALVAVAVRARARGYGGPMEFVAAYRPGESAPVNLVVFRHRETPGIADFLNAADGGTRALDGVAGATVTARALQRAAAALGEHLRAHPPFPSAAP